MTLIRSSFANRLRLVWLLAIAGNLSWEISSAQEKPLPAVKLAWKMPTDDWKFHILEHRHELKAQGKTNSWQTIHRSVKAYDWSCLSQTPRANERPADIAFQLQRIRWQGTAHQKSVGWDFEQHDRGTFDSRQMGQYSQGMHIYDEDDRRRFETLIKKLQTPITGKFSTSGDMQFQLTQELNKQLQAATSSDFVNCLAVFEAHEDEGIALGSLLPGPLSSHPPLGTADLFQRLLQWPFLPLPKQAIRPKDSWSRTIPYELKVRKGELRLTYEYVGIETVQKQTLHRIQFAGQFELLAGFDSMTSALKNPGTSRTISGTAWFDNERGRLDHLEAKYVWSSDPSHTTTATLQIAAGPASDVAFKLPEFQPIKEVPTAEAYEPLLKQWQAAFDGGDFAEAVRLVKEMLRLDADHHNSLEGPDEPSFPDKIDPVTVLHRIGRATICGALSQQAQGDLVGAELRFKRAAHYFQLAGGVGSPGRGEALWRLGLLYLDQDQTRAAAEPLREALAIARQNDAGIVEIDLDIRAGTRYAGDSERKITRVGPTAKELGFETGQEIRGVGQPGGLFFSMSQYKFSSVDWLKHQLRGPAGTMVVVEIDSNAERDRTLQLKRPATTAKAPTAASQALVDALVAQVRWGRQERDADWARQYLEEATNRSAQVKSLPAVSLARLENERGALQLSTAKPSNGLDTARTAFAAAERLLAGAPQAGQEYLAEYLSAQAGLAQVAFRSRQGDQAIAGLQRAQVECSRRLPATHPALRTLELWIGEAHLRRGELPLAAKTAEALLAKLSASSATNELVVRARHVLAQAARQQGRLDEAFHQLELAAQGIERTRGSTGGGDVGRSHFLARLSPVYDDAIRWRAEAAQLDRLAEAMERSRARILLDHLDWYGADLMRGAIDRVNFNSFADKTRTDARIQKLYQSGDADPASVSQLLFGDSNLISHILQLQSDRRKFQDWYQMSAAARQRKLAELPSRPNDQRAVDPPHEQDLLAREILELPMADRRRLFQLFFEEEQQAIGDLLRRQRQRNRLEADFWTEMVESWKPSTLAEMKSWATHRRAFLLEYAIGEQASYLLVVNPAGVAQAFPLQVPAEVAQRLETKPGPLTGALLQQWLLGSDQALIPRLSDKKAAAETIADLALTASMILPPPVVAMLRNSDAKQVAIVPDGALSRIPFEALVVDRAGPVHLLDVAPPVHYVQSFTLLQRLEKRARAEKVQGVAELLTFVSERSRAPTGKPAAPASWQPRGVVQKAPISLAMHVTRKLAYDPAGNLRSEIDQLAPLPYSQEEAAAVGSAFAQASIGVEHLEGEQATEEAFRRRANRRRVLLISAHGLERDQGRGNDGLLVLRGSPPPLGPQALTKEQFLAALPKSLPWREAPANIPSLISANSLQYVDRNTYARWPVATDYDGLLTLDEICDLNLHGCELVFASACHTNSGPWSWGEGNWAISRGFLVAGARRVIASQWRVEDEAGGAVVANTARILAPPLGRDEEVDYAAALRAAKLSLRKQFSNPYYWATLVLVGPS